MRGDREVRRAEAVKRNRDLTLRILTCTLTLVVVAVANGVGAQAQAPKDQAAKTQPAGSQAAGKQPPEPVTTDAGKQKINGDNVAELRDVAWDELAFYLTSSNPAKRVMGLVPLAVLADEPKAVTWLTKMLAEDKEEDVRAQAASVLGEAKVKQGIPALRVALDDPKGPVAFAAAKSLWDLEDTSGMPMFREILLGTRKGGDGVVAGQIHDAKRAMRDPKQLAILGANGVTGVFLGPAVLGLKMAEQGMQDSGAVLRAYSATMVGKDKSDRASKVLYDGLKDSNGLVRASVCRAFAVREETAALGTMRDTMTDKAPVARVMASAAVIRLTARPLSPGALKKSAPRTSTPSAASPKSKSK